MSEAFDALKAREQSCIMGSIPGVILGALALVALPEMFRGFELYRMLAFGGAMAVMMVVRPAGFWPAARLGKRSDDTE